VGVSFDEPEANAKFVEKFSFPFPILSDADKSIAIAYGAAADASAKYANRITVVIGADGRVERIYGKVDPKTHANTVLTDSASAAGGR
jgi:thioredoxin-dependent peroxiredoxin